MNPLYAQALFQAEEPPGGWPGEFAIVTAHNPDGETVDGEQNAKLDARLAARLQELGCWHWRITGGSSDFQHAEPGYAVSLSLAEAIELGREFAQEAIFWVGEGDALSVVSCGQEDESPALGSWRNRLARGNAGPRKVTPPPHHGA